MKHGIIGLASLLVLGLAGCATPVGDNFPQWSYVDPPVDGHYAGKSHDFAGRFNPDPLGRKFRVAYLTPDLVKVDHAMGPQALQWVLVQDLSVTFQGYMAFREQARNNERAEMRRNESERDFLKAHFAFSETQISHCLAAAEVAKMQGGRGRLMFDFSYLLGESVPYEFMSHRHDMDSLNAQLASRYPNLFTTESSGFPLDVAMLGFYVPQNAPPFTRARFEAWLMGLPEDAVQLRIFEAEEAFLDPYEAVAAAVFKLTDEQFEGLEPANPKDHEWLEQK